MEILLTIYAIGRGNDDAIEEVFKKHKGKQHLNFTVFDKDENLYLQDDGWAAR